MLGLCRYILVVAASVSLMGDVMAVTDEEFQELSTALYRMNTENEEKFRTMGMEIQETKKENNQLRRLVQKLLRTAQESEPVELDVSQNQPDQLQNVTIEERVSLLELQVVDRDEDVDFLFDEQAIQDERLLGLENRALDVESRMLDVENEVEDLQGTTLQLNFRVTTLEENSGEGGNGSISELEVRVESLENTTTDQEARLSAAEANIEDLEAVTDDQTTRITAAEENIQGLQATDNNHDSRITALEESGGGGSQNGTIAFHATVGSPPAIEYDTNVIFDDVRFNSQDSYDATTGVFTIPPGGDGVYYFSTYLVVWPGDVATFHILLNDDDMLCTAYGDHDTRDSDHQTATCSTIVDIVEGDEIKVRYDAGTDTTPLRTSGTWPLHGFKDLINNIVYLKEIKI